MPNLPNAWKALRQSKRRAARNARVRDGVTYLRRQYTRALASGDTTAAMTALRAFQRSLDRATQKGVVKPNTASRLLSRATKKLVPTK